MEPGDRITYRVGDLLVDLGRGQVTRNGNEVPLPRLSFDLFVALIRAAPNLRTQDELMAEVWPGLVVAPETVAQRAKLLRQALGDDPRQPRYVSLVRGRGYRLVAPVAVLVADAEDLRRMDDAAATTVAPSAVDPLPPVSKDRKPDRRLPLPRRTMAVLLAGVALLSLSLTVGIASKVRSGSDDELPSLRTHAGIARPVLAVLPFAALGGPEDHLALPDGLQSDILTELSRSTALDVIAATSVEQFRGSTAGAKEIGARLGATHLLEGGVQRVGNRVRINAQLIDVPSQSHVWAATYDRELTTSNIFAIQREVALAVAGALQVVLAHDRVDVRPAPTESIEAWAMDKAARTQLSRRTIDSLAEAERLFRQAIALDPKFGRAFAGLADAVWLRADQEGRPWLPAASEAERLVNIALRLDERIPEAWATRAKLAQERMDYETAEVSYRRAFELNPSYARGYVWYAQYMLQRGHERAARAAVRRAAELDPASAPVLVNAALALLDAEDPTEALAWIDRAKSIDPASPMWALGLATANASVGRYELALHWDLEALDLDPRSAYPMAGAARWHLALDDLDGARTWVARAASAGVEMSGTSSTAALLHLYSGETAEAAAMARRALALDPRDPDAYLVLDAISLGAGDAASVITTVRNNFPNLAAPETPRVSRASLVPATDLALALRLEGNLAASNDLLDSLDHFLAEAREHDTADLAIHEIRVAATRGNREAALRGMNGLIAGGWRGAEWRYYRDHDPALEALRSDPRFRKFFAPVEIDIRAQRERAELSGDLGRVPRNSGAPKMIVGSARFGS